MTLYTDVLHRIAYATDASAYREMPLAVAYPATEEDIKELIAEARRRGTHLIPRAGGTSIAGQVVGDGIVVDISRHFNHILEVNPEERWVWVEPGVVRDELNLFLKPHGLFFSPETSTSNRCCIGGMVGNNSCGTHSLVYGSTRHHVLEIRGLLSDGSSFTTASREGSPLIQQIYAQLEDWAADPAVRQRITDSFPDPSLRRRSCGYAIDEALNPNLSLLPGAKPQPEGVDLCKLICGSEGTLCFITAVKLSLDPLPPQQQMVLCAHCNSLPQSYQANLSALRHNPVAIELMDGKILELCRNNRTQDRNRFFRHLAEKLAVVGLLDVKDGAQVQLASADVAVARVWALRKAGLGVLTGVKGDNKPIGVVEDTAVAPERLPQYLDDFQQMMQRLGLECVYYGHISTGELHLRPILNIKEPHDRKLFRQVAEETGWTTAGRVHTAHLWRRDIPVHAASETLLGPRRSVQHAQNRRRPAHGPIPPLRGQPDLPLPGPRPDVQHRAMQRCR